MHFLLSPMGSAGDVHPFLGLGLALRRRGHEVTVFTSSYFRETVQRQGLRFVELGTREEFLAAANHPDLWHPLRSFGHIFRAGIEPVMRRQYDALKQHYEPGNTVAVVNLFGFGGLVAQEKLGLPTVTVHLQPAVIWSDIAPPHLAGQFGPNWLRSALFRVGQRMILDPVATPPLNRFREELGLAPITRIVQWWHSPWCTACLFPSWYAAPQADWPTPLVQTDFPLWDDAPAADLPDEVAGFLEKGAPPIAFTPGSANRFGARFFVAALEASRRLGRRAILLTRFPDQLPADLPPSVLACSYAPFEQLLPECAAIVHHGGIGTSAQGLAAGVPQLLMTLAHDQFDNAVRLRRLGVADALLPRRFHGGTVAKRLGRLLEEPQVLENCRTLAQRITRGAGLQKMATLLEERAQETFFQARPSD